MPGSMTDFAEAKVADALLGGGTLGAPATWYLGLFTTTPNDAGAGGVEAAWTSYARVSITNNSTNWPNYAAGLKQNGVDFSFVAAGSGPTDVVGWGLFDAASSGNLWFFGDLVSTPKQCGVDASTDIFLCPAHGFADTNTVRLRAGAGDTFPTGISEGVTYFVRDATTDTFKLALTSGGAAINITVSGSALIGKQTTQTVASGNIARATANAIKVYFF
jgi:hypothetical protein